MKISKIRYGMATTINLGDYENLKTNREIKLQRIIKNIKENKDKELITIRGKQRLNILAPF